MAIMVTGTEGVEIRLYHAESRKAFWCSAENKILGFFAIAKDDNHT
jgi:hypothetical protein